MKKLTAIIPTGNEEHNIVEVLQSVQFADEIIVVDSFSKDRTVELAQPLCNKVLQREYENSASQKNWTIPQAEHEWILLVDADERVTPELEQEIKQILSAEPKEVAYWIKRKNHFMGRPVNYSGWQNDKVIRLFRKSKCRYEDKHVHAEVLADGEVGILKNTLHHNTYVDFDSYVAKINRYAWWQAKDYDKKVSKIGFLHLVIKPFLRFCKHFVMQGGFRDGVTGFTIASMQAYAVRTRYIKMWILRQNQNKNE